jgi:hypothetical protein
MGVKMGRKITHKPTDHYDAIIDWISSGKTLRDYCRQEGAPTHHVVYKWLENDAEFERRFARARVIGFDMIAQEALDIIDTQAEFVTSVTAESRDSAHVTWLKNRADFRLKLLAKWDPKRYGDKLDLTSSDKSMSPAAALTGFKLVPLCTDKQDVDTIEHIDDTSKDNP